MTFWTVKKKIVWYIYADGKEITKCNTEESALELMNSILTCEEVDDERN